MAARNKPLAESRNPQMQNSREASTGGPPKSRSSRSRSDSESSKKIQGGTAAGQPSSPQLGSRTADAMNPSERGGMGSTEGRTGSETGLGSAERSRAQERSRGGQMGRGGSGDTR